MSQLVEFYRGSGRDVSGRTLDLILSWDDEEFEAVHDFIQWLFPLPEPSGFNRDAPLLTDEDIAAFAAAPELRANLRRSYERFLNFLGLRAADGGAVVEGANFALRSPEVWDEPNHNWLRLTRVLRSLYLLGLRDEAAALFAWVVARHQAGRIPADHDTLAYWSAASRGLKR